MTGMAVLLLVRPIVRHRDRFAQSDERGDGRSADGEHLDRAREHRGSNAGFLLGHHLRSGESALRATGNPTCSAAATAASAEFARCSRALATPQAAASCLLSDSESVGRPKPRAWATTSSHFSQSRRFGAVSIRLHRCIAFFRPEHRQLSAVSGHFRTLHRADRFGPAAAMEDRRSPFCDDLGRDIRKSDLYKAVATGSNLFLATPQRTVFEYAPPLCRIALTAFLPLA